MTLRGTAAQCGTTAAPVFIYIFRGCLEQTDIIIMDFAKAFNKVNHSLLVKKLEHCGINGRVNS